MMHHGSHVYAKIVRKKPKFNFETDWISNFTWKAHHFPAWIQMRICTILELEGYQLSILQIET